MQNFSLLDFLKNNKEVNHDLYDCLKYELDQHIYYYGDHFKYPKEKLFINSKSVLKDLKTELLILKCLIKRKRTSHKAKSIVSNAYFNVNSELTKLGYNVFPPVWKLSSDGMILTDRSTFLKCKIISDIFQSDRFAFFLSKDFESIVTDFYSELCLNFKRNDIKGLIVPNDVAFFENISIKACKELDIPSFIFLHGLPGRYNLIDENRSDYLIVWGESIKENYVKTGFDPSKILVSGHPLYSKLPSRILRFSTDHILVLTKSMNGGQHSDGIILSDRGNTILYLIKIQRSLQQIGVKRIRYRLHPSENYLWYKRFLDPEFFILDTLSLEQSLRMSTMVIGPTSTVMLESIYHGVNYLIFEPNNRGIDMLNYPLVPPFDGLNCKVPVANTEDELITFIQNKNSIDISFLEGYLQFPFKIDFIKNII